MLCEQDNCRNYAVKGTTRCFVHKNFVLYLFNCLQRGKADEYIKYYKIYFDTDRDRKTIDTQAKKIDPSIVSKVKKLIYIYNTAGRYTFVELSKGGYFKTTDDIEKVYRSYIQI